MPHLLSKSDFKHARSCVTKLYYKKEKYPSLLDDDPYLELLAEGGYMIEEIARNVYPDGVAIDYTGGREEAAKRTREALAAGHNTLFEPTFISEGKLIRVDIFRQTGDAIQLIEVKAKSWDSDDEKSRATAGKKRVTWGRKGIHGDWEDYIADVAYQTMVLREVFPDKTITPYLFMPDKAKTTSIDLLHKHFTLNKHVNPSTGYTSYDVKFTGDAESMRADHFLTLVDVTEEVEYMMPTVRAEAEALLETLRPAFHRHQAPLTPRCKVCEYRIEPGHDSEHISGIDSQKDSAEDVPRSGFIECWGRLGAHKPHIFDLYYGTTLQRGGDNLFQQLIDCGQTSLLEMDETDLCKVDGTVGKRNERQLIQLRCSREGEEYQDPRLVEEMSALAYPLHFIDFETLTMAVPYHAGMKPYELVAFQWSCHGVSDPGGDRSHAEWINVEDTFPNFAFARSLYEHIGYEGSVLIWSPHENTVLRKIREQMDERGVSDQELEEWLDWIVSSEGSEGQMADMLVWCRDYYFHPMMGGRTGLKYVLGAIWATSEAVRKAFPEYVVDGEDGSDGSVVSPYEALGSYEFDGRLVSVSEGTEAMRAYEAMMYGLESQSVEQRASIRELLLRYCELDTAAMVMICEYWAGERRI